MASIAICLWIKDMHRDVTHASDFAMDVYEDNKAATRLASSGTSTSDGSRRIHIRNNYVG